MKKIILIIIAVFSLTQLYSQTEITVKELKNELSFLASDSLKGRFPGTQEGKIAASYIRDNFKNAGLKLLGDNGFQYFDVVFNLKQDKAPASLDTTGSYFDPTDSIRKKKIKTQNVVAILEAPDKNAGYIIIGAHYDHLGLGGPGSGSRAIDTIAVHNGADDNGSGIVSVMEIAEKLVPHQKDLKYSIVFMGFGAEERGLLGSEYFTQNPLIDLKKVKLMINLDMVGRYDPEKTLNIGGVGTAKSFKTFVETLNTDLKISTSESGYGPSDHASFYKNDIPVLYFNTGVHEDYHTPKDDIEYINFDGMKKIDDLIADVLLHFATDEKKLVYQDTGLPPSPKKGSKLKVKMGIMPGFGDNSNKGLRVDGVSKNGPAAKAGIQKHDYIVGINGEPVKNIYDYMDKLSKIEPGQTAIVDILRGDKKLVILVQF